MVKKSNGEKNLYKNILKQALQLRSHNTAKPTQRSPCQTHHTRTKHPAPLPCRLPCQHSFPTMPLHGAMGGRPSAAPSALQPHRLPELIQEPAALRPKLGTRWAPPWQKESQDLSRGTQSGQDRRGPLRLVTEQFETIKDSHFHFRSGSDLKCRTALNLSRCARTARHM